jgi:hypothetical protein
LEKNVQLSPTETHDICGRKIMVFDDFLEPSQVINFATVVMQLGFRRRESFDRELNVGIGREAFVRAPFLHPATSRAFDAHREAFSIADASTKLSHVYSAAMTLGPTPQIHADHPSADAVTFLYYANLRWDESWEGETVFYSGDEPAVRVRPRPGRLAMFHSNILHRAGLPHADAPTFRYTVSIFYYPEDPPNQRVPV